MKKLLALIMITISISSCEILSSIPLDPSLLETGPDNVAGLKEALEVGAKYASRDLGSTDGYFKNELYKILLPEEVQTKINAFKAMKVDVFGVVTLKGEDLYKLGNSTLGIKSLQDIEDELILGINRAAESAASEAAPIFVGAIKQITFDDANKILFGGQDDAATEFLKRKTYQSLVETYQPKVSAAISSVQVNNKSVEDIYGKFVGEYNKIVSKEVPTGLLSKSTIGEIANLTEIENVNLSEFATEEGLHGLFLRVEKEEANIRNNAAARVSQILKDVFGQLD